MTLTPRAGPSTLNTDSPRLKVLREMLKKDNLGESGADSSTYSNYDTNLYGDGSTIASLMLPIFACAGGGTKKLKKKRQGKQPGPKATGSLGGSLKHPQKQKTESEKVHTNQDKVLKMPYRVAMEMLVTAIMKVMAGHFTKL